MNGAKPQSPLITGVSQYEVDFVVPLIGIDLPLCIDPFLLFKSRRAELRQLHKMILDVFNAGINAVRQGALKDAARIMDFPEVTQIGFGYARDSKRGSGVGTRLTQLIIETLLGSPALQERGVRHVEEMQLVSVGIGPDRISDITANPLKHFLIEYTQKQCSIWNLPMQKDVPLSHIYNQRSQSWEDDYVDLPTNPVDATPILLVPRHLVRALPWINYENFLRTEFAGSSRPQERAPPLITSPRMLA